VNESQERFKVLFEKSTDPTFLIDGDRFVDCNEAALRLLHCPAKEQLAGLQPSTISPEKQPDGRMSSEKVRELIRAAAQEGSVRFEWKHRTFGGADFWVDVSLATIPVQGKQIIYAIWRDITEKKKMEEKLEIEMQRFMTIIENAPFGMVLLDAAGNHLYMNAKFKELFGYDLRDVPNEDAWFEKAYTVPEYRSRVIATWWNEIDKLMKDPSLKEGRRWTFTVTCRDGQQKVVQVTPVQLPTGECLKAYHDITQQKEAEEELRSREAELALKSTNLQDVNTALRVLLNERENDRIRLEEKIVSNVDKLVLPYVDDLKKSQLDPSQMTYVDTIETNLKNIVSPFLQELGLRCVDLTPMETRIADLVRSGKTTKEIGQLLQMSVGAINFHRNNIRKKLGLNNRKINLTSYLSSLR